MMPEHPEKLGHFGKRESRGGTSLQPGDRAATLKSVVRKRSSPEALPKEIGVNLTIPEMPVKKNQLVNGKSSDLFGSGLSGSTVRFLSGQLRK